MTEARQEALKQALLYCETAAKKPTPEQIVVIAKKFEAFLDPKKGKR